MKRYNPGVSFRRLLALDLALLGLMILASRAALLVHEALGHGLTGWWLGAERLVMRLSPLGGGYVAAWFPGGRFPTGAGRVLFLLGGIGLNVATGLLAGWLAVRKVRRGGLRQAFLLMYAAGSVGQALWYVALGFWHGEGDPEGFVSGPAAMESARWMWILPVAPVGLAAWAAGRAWLGFLAAHVELGSAARRLGWGLGTIGLVTAVYLGLWALAWDSRMETTLAERRVEREVTRRLRATPSPTPVPTALPSAAPAPSRTPAPPPVEKIREEVRRSQPFPWAALAMVVAGLAGGAAALRRPPAVAEPVAIPAWALALPPVLAGLAVGAIALL